MKVTVCAANALPSAFADSLTASVCLLLSNCLPALFNATSTEALCPPDSVVVAEPTTTVRFVVFVFPFFALTATIWRD